MASGKGTANFLKGIYKRIFKSKSVKKVSVLGTGGGVATWLANKALDVVSDLLKNKGNASNSVILNKKQKEKPVKETTKPISQNIVIKKHDYPNTYRVQLNKLSNEINYAIKQDKISNRKTDTKYQSILCKKLFKKITLHTAIQNDLIINEIYNLMQSKDEKDDAKKTFIGNVLDLITPKNGKKTESFANAGTLKELRDISKTQVKIYMALKELSLNLKPKKTDYQHSQKTVSRPGRSGAVAVSGGGNSSSLLNGLLGAALGAGILGVMGLGAGDEEDGEKGEPTLMDQAKLFFADVAKSIAGSKANKAIKDVVKKPAKPASPSNPHTPAPRTPNTPNTPDKTSGIINKLKNSKFLASLRKLLTPRLVTKLAAACAKLSKGVLGALSAFPVCVGIQLLIAEWQINHMDEILGPDATATEQEVYKVLARAEALPLGGFIISLIDTIPLLLNLAGELEPIITPILGELLVLYKTNKLPAETKWEIMKEPCLSMVFDAASISPESTIKALKTFGACLRAIDPNALTKALASVVEVTNNSARIISSKLDLDIDSPLVEQLVRDGYLKKVSSTGINDYEVDYEKIENVTPDIIDTLVMYHETGNKILKNDAIDVDNLKQIRRRKINEMGGNEEDIERSTKYSENFKNLALLNNESHSFFMCPGNDYLYVCWRQLIEESLKYKNFDTYTPKVIKMIVPSSFGIGCTLLVFLYGTVAKLKDKNKCAWFSDNLVVVGQLKVSDDPVISNKPVEKDEKCFEYYNSKDSLKISEAELEKRYKELTEKFDDVLRLVGLKEAKLTEPTYATRKAVNRDVEASKAVNGSTGLSGPSVQGGQNSLSIPLSIGGAQASTDNNTGAPVFLDTPKVNNATGSGVSYLKSKFLQYRFDMVFVLRNEMVPRYYEDFIGGKIMLDDEIPLAVYKPPSLITDFMGNCNTGRYFCNPRMANGAFMPHTQDLKTAKYKPGRRSRHGLCTYVRNSIDCAAAWCKENIAFVRKKIRTFDSLNIGMRTVIADIMYHAGGYAFGGKNYKQFIQCVDKGDYNAACYYIANVIDQRDGGIRITSRINRRVALWKASIGKSDQDAIAGIDMSTESAGPVESPGPAPEVTPEPQTPDSPPISTPGAGTAEAAEAANTPEPVENADNAHTPTPIAPIGTAGFSVPSEPEAVPDTSGGSGITPTPIAPIGTAGFSVPSPTPQGAQTDENATNENQQSEDEAKKEQMKKMVVNAATYASAHAKRRSIGYCARYVANALQASGFKFQRQPSAYMYHTNGILSQMGFKLVHRGIKGFSPQIGDVCVINRFPGHQHGHICIYNGKQWISDFRQRSATPYYAGAPGGAWYYRLGGEELDLSNVEADGQYAGDMLSGAYNNSSGAEYRSSEFSQSMRAGTKAANSRNKDAGDHRNLSTMTDQQQASVIASMKAGSSVNIPKNISAKNANAFFSFPVFEM